MSGVASSGNRPMVTLDLGLTNVRHTGGLLRGTKEAGFGAMWPTVPGDAGCRPVFRHPSSISTWTLEIVPTATRGPQKVRKTVGRCQQWSTLANDKRAGETPHGHHPRRSSSMGETFRFNV